MPRFKSYSAGLTNRFYLHLMGMIFHKNGRFSLINALLAGIVLSFVPSEAKPAFGFKLDGSLDKEEISKSYFEGDFYRVLAPLEQYRQSFPRHSTREDSIFVYKYLSVIYAADSTTRKKAESYMIQLIKLMPTIELLDLYISDNIQAIFNNVRKDFEKQQQYVRDHDAYGRPVSDSSRPGNGQPKKSSKAWIGWTAAGVGAAAIAGTAIYLMSDENEPTAYKVKP